MPTTVARTITTCRSSRASPSPTAINGTSRPESASSGRSLGHTIVYGEGGQYLDQIGPAALNLGITSSDFSYWGLGAVQEIDSAAMSVWLKYRKHQAEVTGGNLGNIDDIDFVAVGSIINF